MKPFAVTMGIITLLFMVLTFGLVIANALNGNWIALAVGIACLVAQGFVMALQVRILID